MSNALVTQEEPACSFCGSPRVVASVESDDSRADYCETCLDIYRRPRATDAPPRAEATP